MGLMTSQPIAPPAASDARPSEAADDDRLTVMGLLAEAFGGLATRGAAQLAVHGMAPVEFEVLLRLTRSPLGLLRMTDLSAQTSLTTSGVTRVVDRLVDRGLVTRQACQTDRRTTYAVVTDAGRALLEARCPDHLALIEQWLIGPLRAGDDLDTFVRLLRRVRDHVVPCATAGSGGPALPRPAD